MGWIKEKVEGLYKKYNTRNPFTIAKKMNIQVFFWDLPTEIRGFYQYEKRNRFIFINNNLSYEDQLTVCAHELGHAILHTQINTSYMRTNTFLSVNKIEREANRFAAELLIPDSSFEESNNIYEIASLHQVPVELVKLKCEKLF
ncbi:ImmA/IrrE family metallo-endopeptidase [Lysinibacillus telephonicus]|uniref:ImmA/IrrE family metallo-endopeptidase n=1 Tax=Lysinibacillus telephonicus TaxID=1714840 RepID=UPI0037DC411C